MINTGKSDRTCEIEMDPKIVSVWRKTIKWRKPADKKVAGVKFLQSIVLMTQNKAIKCIHLLHKIKLRLRDLGKEK